MAQEPLYPEVVVQLTGQNGNAYNLMGIVRTALRRTGHGDAVEEFTREAKSGDYDHLLQTCMKYVTVE